MFQQMKKRMKNEKGLTLIELLAVIVILAIIAAIAIPAIGNIIDNSRGKALVADATNVMSAANLYFADNPPTGANNDDKVTLNQLISAKYIESEGKLASATVTYVPGGSNTIIASGTNGGVSLNITTGITLKQLGGKVTVNNKTVSIEGVSSKVEENKN